MSEQVTSTPRSPGTTGDAPSPPASQPTSARALGPVRTGRDTPNRPEIPGAGLQDDPEVNGLEIPKKDPLPPIGQSSEESAELKAVPVKPIPDPAEIASSMANSNGDKSTSGRRPRIMSYRRELSTEEQDAGSISTSKPTEKAAGTAVKPSVTRTIECQTEWSWMEDMKVHQQTQRSARGSARSMVSPQSDTEDDLDFDLIDQSSTILHRGLSSAHSSLNNQTIKPPASAVSGASSELTAGHESTHSIPFPSKEDEYGIPILHLDSDSDSSDEDSLYQYQYQKDEGEGGKPEDGDTLPSIGPPEILKYQRESGKQDIDAAEPADRAKEEGGDGVDIQEMKGGVFQGNCEFCEEPIKAFPSVEEQQTQLPEEIYCCDQYREFIEFMLTHPLHEEQTVDKQIDVKPHPPYGSKHARKEAKERAAQRMRERELARQQAAIAAGLTVGGGPTASVGQTGGGGGGGPANFYQFARAMKTINYQLSSQRCLEEGWTVRPPTPLLDGQEDPEVFEPEPIQPPWADSQAKTKARRALILKYYQDGSKFVIFFPDGTGNVFYPSGRVAVSITSQEQGLYTYILQADTDSSQVVGVFQPDGHAMSNYIQGGGTRVYLDQIGGVELDPRGARKKRWSWKDQVEHVHAPPIQPLTFAMTPQLGVRIMGQDNITLTFTAKQRSCRFQIGAKLRLVAPEFLPPPDIDEDELYRTECYTRIQSLMTKVHNLLRFPNSPKLDKLPTPPHIASKLKKIEEVKEIRASRLKLKKGQGRGDTSDQVEAPPTITVN